MGRHLMIVCRYEITYIRKLITGQIEKCDGDSWPAVAQKVSQIGLWEFEENKAAMN